MRPFQVFCIALISLLSVGAAQAQNFSDDPEEFYGQALTLMRSFNTEATYQVSNKFATTWNNSLTQAQKEKVVSIGTQMLRKGHNKQTFFNYFAYIAYAVQTERLPSSDLSELLEINEEILKTRRKSEYAEFVFGLNYFFARRYLTYTRAIKTQALGGSYDFEILEGASPYDTTPVEEDTTSADPFAEENDPWTQENNNDPWADQNNDPWADQDQQDDPWGDNQNDDPWADQNDDPWGDKDNTQSDDPWGDNNAAASAPVPERPEVQPPLPEDYVAEMKANYQLSPDEGPAIKLVNVNFFIKTPYDTMTITNVKGNYLLKNRIFSAKGGRLNWPAQHDKMEGAIVKFGDWYIESDRDHFWTPNATLTYPKFSDQPIEGKFEFKSKARGNFEKSEYPVFASHNADVNLNLSDKANYTGGLEVRGSKFYGKATSREKGTLELIGSNGTKVLIEAREFVLADSVMTTDRGALKIIHSGDTIHHPAVKVNFDTNTEQLNVFVDKNGRTNAFHSSYFGVNIYADRISYNLAADSMTMNIMNAKQSIPMIVESDQYFNGERLKKMNPIFRKHPVTMAVAYSKKYGNIRTFYDLELAEAYDLPIATIRGQLKILEQYDMIKYNRRTSEVTLLDKIFHYYESSAKNKDFDHIYIEALADEKDNAVLKLDSGHLVLNGVRSFSITDGYGLEIEPDSTEQITLLQNRNFRFNGKIKEEDFTFHGRNFEFSYDQFQIDMPKIDSMQLKVPLDTSHSEDYKVKKPLSNTITNTSGILYVENPQKKAGIRDSNNYPFFNSSSEGVVYFDGPEILNGAYDRSVFFVIEPFKEDSTAVDTEKKHAYKGTFNSGGIFPVFQETLKIQPDGSLGFTHETPKEGYNLYRTDARTYEEIKLSNKGLRGSGEIDFLATQIYSEDFIFYPDSVTAKGTNGRIKPGTIKGTSYPEAVLGAYDVHWLPRKDSMYLHTLKEPFKFYEGTAQLEGYANVTTSGVFGGGTMKTRGTVSKSDDFAFEEFSYSGRNVDFMAESDNPDKPALAGNNIALDFDLRENAATLQPEKTGEPAISFPYAQMKTSITRAIWDLDEGLVTMTKPENVAIEDSYFYSTREDLDSLVFSGEKAIYNMETYELKIEGIPYITVADSRIIPEGNTTTILENSELQQFQNARIIIDTLNAYHQLNKGQITILSRNKFQGSAFYQVIVESDTFEIRFDSFDLKEVPVSTKETRLMTVSGGEVPERQDLKIAPGFFYKGSVDMFAYKKALELHGHVKLDVENIDVSNLWIPFTRTDSSLYPHIPIENAVFEDGKQAIAGLHWDSRGDIYATFAEKYREDTDVNLFKAQGELSYERKTGRYRIETPSKSAGGYAGYTMIYDDATSEIEFEGPASFFKPTTTDISMRSAISGSGSKVKNDYTLNAFMLMNFDVTNSIPITMGDDILLAVERLGANPANEPTDKFLYKLANFIGDQGALKYRESLLGGYTSLMSMSGELEASLAISDVTMNWSPAHQSWYSTSKIGISHTDRVDVNAKIDGFMEMKRDDTGADVMNLFLQAGPDTWYYISYHDKTLVMYSSNREFNEIVKSKSNINKQKPGELLFVIGDTNETLGFVNEFRKKYYGINEPYKLSSPSDVSVEDEQFKTIEEDDDDLGF